MLNPALAEDHVRAIILSLAEEDPVTGERADAVWTALTAGGGPEGVTQAGLQTWLWDHLPGRNEGDPEHWLVMAAAAAELFELLGEHEYAAICLGSRTQAVFQAWLHSARRGRKATRAAVDASGVHPPDLDDFAWSDRVGPWEADARRAVERALEAAICQGRLRPGERGWRVAARSECARILGSPHPAGIGQTWRSLVTAERAEAWATAPWLPPEQVTERSERAPSAFAPRLPPEPPAAAEALAPLRWLTARCIPGLPLTATSELAVPDVVEAADRFGWWPWDRTPPNEAAVGPLRILRTTATALGVVRRRGGQLTITSRGYLLLRDPMTQWDAFVDTLGGSNEYERTAADELALAIGDGDAHDWADAQATVQARLAAQRWRDERGVVHAAGHAWVVAWALLRWRTWGLAAFEPSPCASSDGDDGRTAVRLTVTGRSAVSAWLYQRITGPRHDR